MKANNKTLREFIPYGENVILECEGYLYVGYDYEEYTFAVTENAVWMASDENETDSDFIKASVITGMSRDTSDDDDYFIVSIRDGGEPIHAYFDDEEIAKEFYKAIVSVVFDCGASKTMA